jgi:hypothetical protein
MLVRQGGLSQNEAGWMGGWRGGEQRGQRLDAMAWRRWGRMKLDTGPSTVVDAGPRGGASWRVRAHAAAKIFWPTGR